MTFVKDFIILVDFAKKKKFVNMKKLISICFSQGPKFSFLYSTFFYSLVYLKKF